MYHKEQVLRQKQKALCCLDVILYLYGGNQFVNSNYTK